MEKSISGPLLRAEHLGMCYQSAHGETAALEDIDFSMAAGEFLAIVGPSGCGKTTVLSLIAGLLRPSSGRVLIQGEPVAGAGAARVGYMLQQDHLFPWRSVWANARLGLEIQGRVTAEKEAELAAMLEQYGLAEFAHSLPRQLSGGMRQRVALIRTLAVAPELLLLDEPFSALDYQTRIKVAEDISGIIRSRGQAAILVTHDLAEAISLADRVLVLTPRPGRITAEVAIELPAHGVLARRQAPGFAAYFDLLWKELNQDA